jgi:hypothetical protein
MPVLSRPTAGFVAKTKKSGPVSTDDKVFINIVTSDKIKAPSKTASDKVRIIVYDRKSSDRVDPTHDGRVSIGRCLIRLVHLTWRKINLVLMQLPLIAAFILISLA